ncbi:MAG: hypothetical protein KatS3mg032_1107 [Cyclobacteriaceae bacterium]|nr:MAG: hypothetical protein KatS3mg032_1107 [Cyclobacteriaceae bacterium]
MYMYFVYVIRSRIDGRLYKGMTHDIALRMRAHNSGKVRSTRAYRPWELVYQECFSTMQGARDRELFFKSGQGREYLKAKIL